MWNICACFTSAQGPCAERLHPTPSWGAGSVQGRCAGHCMLARERHSRRIRPPTPAARTHVRTHARMRTGGDSKATPPTACRETSCFREGAPTWPLFDQRFVLLLNWTWTHSVGLTEMGRHLGPDLGGLGNVGKSRLPMLGLLPCHSSRVGWPPWEHPLLRASPEAASWGDAGLFQDATVGSRC